LDLHPIRIEPKLSYSYCVTPSNPWPVVEYRVTRELVICTDWWKTLPLQSDSPKIVIQRNDMIPHRNAGVSTLLAAREHQWVSKSHVAGMAVWNSLHLSILVLNGDTTASNLPHGFVRVPNNDNGHLI
jgi:hypothetical protein